MSKRYGEKDKPKNVTEWEFYYGNSGTYYGYDIPEPSGPKPSEAEAAKLRESYRAKLRGNEIKNDDWGGENPGKRTPKKDRKKKK
jgi:hypothetical protein